jgi:hypothetical protein
VWRSTEVNVRNRLAFRYAELAAACALLTLTAAPLAAQEEGGSSRPGTGEARPAPRWPDGRVNLGSVPGETGTWEGGGLLATNPKNYEVALGRRIREGAVHIDDVPLQPWARALLDYRHSKFIADEPYTRCKPSPGPRSFATAYGVELVHRPEIQRAYLFVIGGPHTFREIFLDGRSHPPDLEPSYMGHSIGHWEGDTLVIDTVGFNERAWMSRDAIPHTEQLHLIERVTRVDYDTLKYEVTFDDPGAYTAPWTSSYTKEWNPGTELFEYICQSNNYGPELMIGLEGAAERESSIVP